MRRIFIDISDDGEVRIETVGFSGASCIEEAKFLKELLGTETYKKLTPAYYGTVKKTTKRYLQLCG